MGSVGINFGSATGGTGFDVTTTVASIVANLQTVEAPWKSQLTSLKAADSAFTSIGTDLATLSSSLQSLTDFEGVFASKQGSSSDSNVLALTSAGSTAVAGSHSIVVTQLAQTSSAYSAVIPAGDTLSGGLTLKVGSGAAQAIPVVAGSSDTLASYAAAINAAGIGVSASIVSDISGSRLSLVSANSGSAGQLTLSGSLTDATASAPIALSAGLPGLDARLTVDGLGITSSSNTISTAIPGVTFQLLTTSPTTPIQVQIANDTSTAESSFSSLVTAYNAVVKDIKTQEGNDGTGAAEPLFGNTVISQLQSSLSLALTSGAASGSVSNLAQLGISVNTDGSLALSTSTLDSVLNSHYQDVVGFLQNSGSFGQLFQNTLDRLGSQSPTGAISLALNADSVQETGLNANVTTQDALIAAQKVTLTTQLNEANQILQAIPQQLNNVDELYNALTGYTPKN